MENSQRWVVIVVLSFVAIGVGCVVWFGFFSNVHFFNREISQEQRANEAVGAKVLPKAPLQIVIKNKPNECRVIDSARLDGSDLWVYYHNACNRTTTDDTIHWNGIAPDGTVIVSGWTYTRSDLESGQKAEFHADDLKDDPRMVTLEVKARWNDNP